MKSAIILHGWPSREEYYDQQSVTKTIGILRSRIKNVMYKEFHNYGHFCYEDMKTIEFPELLQEVLAHPRRRTQAGAL